MRMTSASQSPRAQFDGRIAERIRNRLAQRLLDLDLDLELDYLLVPGALFHVSRQPSTLMRINSATTQAAQFWKVFSKTRAELCRTAPYTSSKPLAGLAWAVERVRSRARLTSSLLMLNSSHSRRVASVAGLSMDVARSR